MADVKISQLPSIASVNPGNTVAPIVTNGTTYQITAANFVYSVLPSLSGQNGKVLGTDGAGLQWVPAGTVLSVNVDGGSTGMTFDGGPVTSTGTLVMSGTLGVLNGGTGATTPAGAINNLLPPQGGSAGLFLRTDGTNVSWVDAGTGTVTSINGSGGATGLTLTGGPITGAGTLTLGGTLAITSGGTGATTQAGAANAILPSQGGNAGKVLSTDGVNVTWIPAGGTGTVTSVNVSGGATGLIFDGGPVTASGTITAGGKLAATHGGTGLDTYATGDMIYASGPNTLEILDPGPNGYVLTMSGGIPAWTAGGGGGSLSGVTQATTPFLTSLGGNANISATGLENTFIGTNAGKVVTTGSNNTVVGADAMAANNGSYNTIVGNNAAVLMTGGNNNTLVGSDILTVATTGSNNTIVGRQAGKVSTGSDNVFIGYQCADLATTLSNSVLIGAYAGAATTAGSNNMVGVGYAALNNLTSGVRNTALGNYAGAGNQTGGDNTSVGDSAGRQATGSNGTYIGSRAGTAVTTGAGNTFVGASSGDVVTTGANNTFVGLNSGGLVTTGGNNTLIGQYQGTTTLQGVVALSDGAGNIRAFLNANGALSFDGTDFGTAGYVLTSSGSTGRPAWAPGGGGTGAVNSVVATAPIVANPTVGNVQLSMQTDPTFTGVVTTTGNLITNSTAANLPGYPRFIGDLTEGQVVQGMQVGDGSDYYGIFYVGDAADPMNNGAMIYAMHGNGLDSNTVGHEFAVNDYACFAVTNNGARICTGDGTVSYVDIRAASSGSATSYQLVLPLSQGAAGTTLVNDGSGNLTWQAGGGGGMTPATPTAIGGVYGRMFGDDVNSTISLGYKTCNAQTAFNNNSLIIGYKSFENATGPINNWVAIGNEIGKNITTPGNFSVAVGNATLQNYTGSSGTVAVGHMALTAATTGQYNTAVGNQAGMNITTGYGNTLLGFNVALNHSTGFDNTFIGFNAAHDSTVGNRNTVIGAGAGYKLTTGGSNVLLGSDAGYEITMGSNNTVVGPYAGQAGTGFSGYVVLAQGAGTVRFMANNNGAWSADGTNFGTSGQVLTSQGPNSPPIWAAGGGGGATPATPTAEGVLYGFTSLTASNNTFLGWAAGDGVTGDKNTFIGRQTGQNVGAGTTNTIVGRYTGTNGLTGHVILADGDGSIRFSSNMGAAVSFDGTTYGTSGQFLMSRGDAQRPIWSDVPATIPATPTVAGVVYAKTNQGSGVGNNNACLGYQAGDGMTGSSCVAVGLGAGQNSGAGLAVAIGNGALKNAAGGAQGCVAIGFNAMSSGMNAPNNIAIGNGAMVAGTSVLGIAIGYQAAAAMTTAQGFVAIGGASLKAATTNTLAVGATAVGYDTFPVATQPANSAAFGFRAGWKTTTGQNNTFIGNLAGSEVTTGGNNTLVGRYTGAAALDGVVALSDGAGNIRAYINNAGALSFDGTNFGTSGQVLQSNGSGARPTWVPGGGGWSAPVGTTGQMLYYPADGTSLTPTPWANIQHGTLTLGGNPPGDVSGGSILLLSPQQSSVFGFKNAGGLDCTINMSGPRPNAGDIMVISSVEDVRNVTASFRQGAASAVNPGLVYGFTGDAAANKNTILGANSGTAISTGTNNIIIGANAANSLSSGSGNTIIGPASVSSADANTAAIASGNGVTRIHFNSNGAVSFGGNAQKGDSGDILVSRGSSSAPQWTSGQDLTGWRSLSATNSPLSNNIVNFTNNGPKAIIVNATASCKVTNSSQILNLGVVYDGLNAPTVQNMSTPIIVGSNVINITFTPGSNGVLVMNIANATSGNQPISYRVAYNVSESY